MGCAVSQDLLREGIVHYGDLVYVEGIGFKYINDTMHSRIKRQFDIWVETPAEEKAHDKKFGKRKLKVWLINKTT
jgi:3D (Asp-Asp-Asp) domain-containing protein